MKKILRKILSSLLVVVMIITVIPFMGLQLRASAASFEDINRSEVFLHQVSDGDSTCAFTSCLNMFRRRAIIDGLSNWSSITHSNYSSKITTNGVAVRWTITDVLGMNASMTDSLSSDKKTFFINMLEEHPEGIVIYCGSNPMHTVLLTDYDSTTDTFYCAETLSSYAYGRIPLSSCYIAKYNGNTQNGVISRISQIWYINNKSGGLLLSEPPTAPSSIWSEKNAYSTNEYITISWSSVNTANDYWIYMWKDGVQLYATDMGNNTSFTSAPTSAGTYTLIVRAGNSYGYSNDPCSFTFIVGIYRCYFNTNGGTCSTASKSVTYDSTYGTLPTPTRTGYTFAGWYTSASGGTKISEDTKVTITSDQTLYAHWTANTNTKYVVNHYQMNVSGSGYTLKETESKTGTTASSVTISDLKKTYTGFTYEGGKGATSATTTKPSTLDTTTTVLADGTRVINIYYSRNKYALTLSKGTGISSVSGAGTYYYGQSVSIDATVATGYTWSKWSDGNTTKSRTYTMPAAATTLTASATATTYTISYTLNGGTVATANPTSYNITTTAFTLNNPTKTGYTFAGWTGTGLSTATTTVTVAKGSTGNRSYTATWTANTSTKYVVNHYQMNVSGSGYTLKETESKTGTTASTVTISDLKKTYTGFTYEGGKGATSATATKPSTLDTTTTVLADGTRVINVYYSRNKYALTLAKGTGISSVSGAGTYYYGQSVSIDATVATGYTWSKWSDGNTTKSRTYTMPAAATTLTASATAITYTISYTLNGGTVATANPTSYNITTTAFTLNNPTKTGYTFAGWTGTGLSTATTTVTVAKGSTGNRSYTANWTANTNTAYKVEHYVMGTDGNYPTTATKTVSKTGTTASTLTLANLKDTSLEVANGIAYANGSVGGTTVTTTTIAANGSTVIKLYYSRSKYTLTLSKGTGISSVSGAGTYYYGQSVSIDATVSAGYTWSKWSDGNTTKSRTYTMPAAATTLTASATATTYTISYTLNGGTVATANPTSYNITTTAFTLNNPTKTGYTFAGWTGTGLSTATTTVTVAKGSTGNRSYTANWNICSYSLIFNANGGSCSTTSKTVEYGTAYGELPTPEQRTGYVFKGWYDAITDGALVTKDTKLTNASDKTLYAGWEHDTFEEKTTANITFEKKLIYGNDILSMSKEELTKQFANSNVSVTMSTSRMSTGTTVNLVDDKGEVYDTMTVVIFGDVNGDGWYDGMDSMLVNCIANGMLTREQVGEAVWTAADCNHDGEINQADVDLLNEAGLLLSQVDQTKSEEELNVDSVYQEYLSLIDQSPTEKEAEKPTNQPEKPAKETKTFADLFKTIFDVFINYFKSLFKITK